MKKLVIGLIILALVVVGYLVLTRRGQVPEKAPEMVMPQKEIGMERAKNTVLVIYQNNAFNPASVKIKVGDSVEFVNNHTFAIRIASNPHPIHTSYPKLESGTVDPGSSYTFTATEKATIKYHNHFNPSAGGEIIVE